MSAIDIKLVSELSRTEVGLTRRDTADAVVEAVALLLASLPGSTRMDAWSRLKDLATAAGWNRPVAPTEGSQTDATA